MVGQILEDVVVIGYGTVKEKTLPKLIQAVTSEKFNRGAITGSQELIAGKVAGVSITTEEVPCRIKNQNQRGNPSLGYQRSSHCGRWYSPRQRRVSGSRNPLNIINPNDIASMIVLKDASATAIGGKPCCRWCHPITTKKELWAAKCRLATMATFLWAPNTTK